VCVCVVGCGVLDGEVGCAGCGVRWSGLCRVGWCDVGGVNRSEVRSKCVEFCGER
jgi:hypothetical protein